MTYNPYEEKRRTETIARLFKENQNLAKQNIDLKNQVKKLNTQVDIQSTAITMLEKRLRPVESPGKPKIAILGGAENLNLLMNCLIPEVRSDYFHIKNEPERNRGIEIKEVIYLRDWELYYTEPYETESQTLSRLRATRV